MRVIFMGTPGYAVPILESLLALNAQIVGTFTQPDKPSGRGRTLQPGPVKSLALEHGIRVFQPNSLRHAEIQREIASLRPEVVVVAAYGKFLPPEVLSIPTYGCVNVHPSLLPRYRGPSPVASAILNGETINGTTVMLIDEGMDSGPILAMRGVPIDTKTATTETITPLLFRVGAELLIEALPLWVQGKISPQPQDNSQATITKKLEKNDGEARWQEPAEVLERRLRAFTPWPGLFTFWHGRTLKILSATPLNYDITQSNYSDVANIPPESPESPDKLAPGLVVILNEPGIKVGVVTGGGVLGIKSLQLEGRRPVNPEEFLRGYRDFPGSRLPS